MWKGASGLCAAFWSKGADQSSSQSASESHAPVRASAFSAGMSVSCGNSKPKIENSKYEVIFDAFFDLLFSIFYFLFHCPRLVHTL